MIKARLLVAFLALFTATSHGVIFIGSSGGGGGFDPGSFSPLVWVNTEDNDTLWETTAKATHPSSTDDEVDSIDNLGSISFDLDLTLAEAAAFQPAGQNGLDSVTKSTSRRWENGFTSLNATQATLIYVGATDAIRSIIRAETFGGAATDQIYFDNAAVVGGDVGVNYNAGDIQLSAGATANTGWHYVVVELDFTDMTGEIWVDGVSIDSDVTTGTAGSVDIDFFSIYRGSSAIGEVLFYSGLVYDSNKADFDTYLGSWLP